MNDTDQILGLYYIDLNATGIYPENITRGAFEFSSADILQAAKALNMMGTGLGTLSVLMNVIFLIVIWLHKDKAPLYHLYLRNLSFADAFASLTFLIITHIQYDAPGMDLELLQVLLYVFRSAPWMFLTGYLLTLLCLSINQYVAVCRPLHYGHLMTTKRVRMSLALVWFFSSLQIFVPLIILVALWVLENKQGIFKHLYNISVIEITVWMGLFASVTFLAIVLNILVYKCTHRLKQNGIPKSNTESTNLRMKKEAFLTVVLLLVASIFCRLPFPVMGILTINGSEIGHPDVLVILNAILPFLLHLNFFVDPLIYFLRMQGVRSLYQAMFAAYVPCRNTPNSLHHKEEQNQFSSSLKKRPQSSDAVNGLCNDSAASRLLETKDSSKEQGDEWL